MGFGGCEQQRRSATGCVSTKPESAELMVGGQAMCEEQSTVQGCVWALTA
jgi:hypothetical protein